MRARKSTAGTSPRTRGRAVGLKSTIALRAAGVTFHPYYRALRSHTLSPGNATRLSTLTLPSLSLQRALAAFEKGLIQPRKTSSRGGRARLREAGEGVTSARPASFEVSPGEALPSCPPHTLAPPSPSSRLPTHPALVRSPHTTFS